MGRSVHSQGLVTVAFPVVLTSPVGPRLVFNIFRSAILQSTALALVAVVVPPDTAAPTLTAPTAVAAGSTGANLGFHTTEGNGTGYYWVGSTSAVPTAANIKNGTGATRVINGSQGISGAGTQGFTGVVGLSPSTQYWVFYLHRDAAGNDSAITTAVTFTTSASAVTLAALSGSFSLAENAAANAVAGALVGKSTGSTLSLVDSAGGRVALSGTNIVRGAASLNYESETSHSFTVRETLAGAINTPRDTVLSLNVTNVLEAGTLATLSLDTASYVEDVGQSSTILGSTSGSTLAITSGALPTGMTLNSGARTITGTPTTPATYNFTITETLADAVGSPRATALSIVITAASAPVTLSALGGTFTLAESAAVNASAGALTGKTSGSTLSLSNDAGGRVVISGTNIVRGTTALDYESATNHSFTVVETLAGATNTPRSTVLSLSVTNVLEAGTLVALTLTGTSYEEDAARSTTINNAVAGSVITVVAGGIPTGMTLNSADRIITGTPTTPGTYNFTMRETLADAVNSPRDTALSIVVTAAGDTTAPTITSANPSGSYAEGQPVGGTATADKAVTWEVTGANASRVTMNPSTGVWFINETTDFETRTSYSFVIAATAANLMTANQTVTITITDVTEGITPYLGVVATRTQAPAVRHGTTLGGSIQSISSTYHDARDDIATMTLLFANWYVTPGAETGSGDTMTVTCKVEYPVGTFTDMLFSGGTSGTAADGATLSSDATPLAVTIPSGKRFKVHIKRVFGANARTVYSNSWAHSPEDGYIQGVDVNSATLGNHINDTYASYFPGTAAPPLAILGTTSKASALVIGDSIEFGEGDVHDNTGKKGYIARLLGSRIGLINCGRGSENSTQFINAGARRTALAAYVTHVFIGHDTNDWGANMSVSSHQANMVTLAGMFPGKVLMAATTAPRSSTSNGQTPYGNEADRVAGNTWRRGTGHPFNIVFEYADQLETARNSGLWKTGYTGDGIHPNQTGHLAIFAAGINLDGIAPAISGDIVPPIITSASAINSPENITAITTLTANESGTWSIRGGRDASRLSINSSTGALTFNTSPDFEAPHDGGANNVYDIDVRFTDSAGLFVGQKVAVTVTDVGEGGGGGVPVVTGTANASGLSDVIVTLPALVADNLILVYVETSEDPVTAPAGYTQIQQNGTNGGVFVGGNGYVRLALFAKRATGAETTVTITDPGNHAMVTAVIVSGVSWTTNPWEASANEVSVAPATSSTLSAPSVTTLGANRLVLAAFATDTDTNTPQGSGYTNANLTSLAEVSNLSTNIGNGGGITIVSGTKATAGATGATTATATVVTGNAAITVAIKP